jgi:hypothetical protein
VSNNFWGGTIEGCEDLGLYFGPNARVNTVWGMDFEMNHTGQADVFLDGYDNTLNGCQSDSLIEIAPASKRNAITGGTYNSINIYAGAQHSSVTDTRYARYDGRFTDFGTNTYRRGNLDIKTGKRD